MQLEDGKRYRSYDTARARGGKPDEHIHIWVDQAGPDPSGGALPTEFEHIASIRQDGKDGSWSGEDREGRPHPAVSGRHRRTRQLAPSAAALARQLLLGVTWVASIDQYPCITAKMYAVLTPNSSIPSTASRAPIIFQCRCSVSPDAPRVLIESTE